MPRGPLPFPGRAHDAPLPPRLPPAPQLLTNPAHVAHPPRSPEAPAATPPPGGAVRPSPRFPGRAGGLVPARAEPLALRRGRQRGLADPAGTRAVRRSRPQPGEFPGDDAAPRRPRARREPRGGRTSPARRRGSERGARRYASAPGGRPSARPSRRSGRSPGGRRGSQPAAPERSDGAPARRRRRGRFPGDRRAAGSGRRPRRPVRRIRPDHRSRRGAEGRRADGSGASCGPARIPTGARSAD